MNAQSRDVLLFACCGRDLIRFFPLRPCGASSPMGRAKNMEEFGIGEGYFCSSFLFGKRDAGMRLFRTVATVPVTKPVTSPTSMRMAM